MSSARIRVNYKRICERGATVPSAGLIQSGGDLQAMAAEAVPAPRLPSSQGHR